MEPHVKIARAHRALAFFYGLLGVVLLFLALFVPGELPHEAAVGAVIVFGTFFAAHYFTARGALEKKGGARAASLIIAILMLAAFPIGTLIGLYLLFHGTSSWETSEKPLPPRAPRQAPTL